MPAGLRYVILIVSVAGVIVGLLFVSTCRQSGGDPAESGRPVISGSGPRRETPRPPATPTPRPAPVITQQQLSAKLQQVRSQLDESFSSAIVEPFIVASDLPPADFQRICRHTIGWALDMLNKDFFSTPPDKIVTIYLFRDKASYHKHAESLFGQRPSTPYGYYSARHQALIMNIATGTGTLVHEMVHPLLAADFPQAPSWFDEGLASLCEQSRQRNERIVGLLNWRLPVLQKGLRAGHLVALEDLLATSTEKFYDDPHGMHYAQARYLCYYLQEKRLLRKFYHQFKANHRHDPSGTQSLLQVTGHSSMANLQKQWLEFLGPLRYNR